MFSLSIIIPVFNAENTVSRCLKSILRQSDNEIDLEIIVVDDASTDNSCSIVENFQSANNCIKLVKQTNNLGPGSARNQGIKLAANEWIMFIDSDDLLHEGSLKKLSDIQTDIPEAIDIIAYNWSYYLNDSHKTPPQRKDLDYLRDSKENVIKQYLMHKMDGSVIFSMIRNSYIQKHCLEFSDGFHEDVDFMFKLYFYSHNIYCADEIVYLKMNRQGSIVNTISKKHIDGYIRALTSIANVLKASTSDWKYYSEYLSHGFSSFIATRLRSLYSSNLNHSEINDLCHYIYDNAISFTNRFNISTETKNWTQYQKIAAEFFRHFSQANNGENLYKSFENTLASLLKSSWSCYDLHNSIFVRPDEIRTCCKRFFANGEMKGDVVLIDKEDVVENKYKPSDIVREKTNLLRKINADEPSPCTGCPFLEFKNWGDVSPLKVNHLSLEYHSVCNLKCTYCSDTYYGGMKPQYDIGDFLNSLSDQHCLDQCQSIVWGGGEPVADRYFEKYIQMLSNNIPLVKQRVLTNSVKYSKTIQTLLDENRIVITTSIDAGDDNTFFKIRGKDKLRNVLDNLQHYAEQRPDNVTIKYIFTRGNEDIQQVKEFVQQIKNHELQVCNFQISSDFKDDIISLENLANMVAMHGLLTEIECRLCFFDDLVWHRINNLDPAAERKIKQILQNNNCFNSIADPNSYSSVVIWGAGWLAKYLVKNSNFFRQVNVEHFIDSTPEKHGTYYLDKIVKKPETITDSDQPIIIAASQGYSGIYDEFIRLGIDKHRLINKIII